MNNGNTLVVKRNGRIEWQVIAIVFSSILFGLHTIYGNLGLNTVASLVLLFILIGLPVEKDIYVYASLIIFYKLIPDASFMRMSYLLLVSITKILLKCGIKFRRRYISCVAAWLFLEVIMDTIYASSIDTTVLLLMIWFALYMEKCTKTDKESNKNIMAIMICSFGVAIVFTIVTSATSLSYYLQTDNYIARFGEDARVLGGAMDIPIFCSIVIAYAVMSLLCDKFLTLYKKIAFLIIIGACLIFGALTVSRSFIVAIVFMGVWIYLSFVFSKKNLSKILPATVIIVLVGAVLVWNYYDAIVNIFVKYSQRDFFKSSRFGVYKDCFNYLFMNPMNLLFGTGAFGYHEMGIRLDVGFQMFAHNLILDAVMSWGIIGTIALFSMIFMYYRELKRNYGKPNMICYLPLVSWGSLMMLSGTFNYVEPYLYVIILIKVIFTYQNLERIV